MPLVVWLGSKPDPLSIFARLGLDEDERSHRRVRAVLAYLSEVG